MSIVGIADRVQCAICRGVLRNWDKDDIPWDEHSKHFGFCRLITGQDARNLVLENDATPPMTIDDLLSVIESSKKYPQALDTASYTRHASPMKLPNGNSTEPSDSNSKPYSTFDCRMESYGTGRNAATSTGWSGAVRSFELAKAGFYMTGNGDEVTCFDCGICVNTWMREDEPLQDHLRYANSCYN